MRNSVVFFKKRMTSSLALTAWEGEIGPARYLLTSFPKTHEIGLPIN